MTISNRSSSLFTSKKTILKQLMRDPAAVYWISVDSNCIMLRSSTGTNKELENCKDETVAHRNKHYWHKLLVELS